MNMPARYPERIVCLTEETTETLYLLGEECRIVGISGYTVRPPQARRDKPRVSAFLSDKTDKILTLKPDLVIGFSALQADIARELAKAGLNVMLFNQRSIEEILNTILVLSSVVGVGEKGVQLIAKLEDGLSKIRVEGEKFSTDRLLVWRSDRKSTRLNSSHGYISYAVFCLKKKKHTPTE